MHFLHVRKTDANGEIITKGGKTFAFEILTDTGEGPITVAYSEARCHGDKQNFDRKIGRMVAEGRYKKGIDVKTAAIQPERRDDLFSCIHAFLANL